MAKLLMITGLGSAKDLASGRQGAFYNTLEEFHKYWDRIDIIAPKVNKPIKNLFGNVFVHPSPWPLFLHPLFFVYKTSKLHREIKFDLMTVQDYPPFYNGYLALQLWKETKVPYVLEIHHIPGYPRTARINLLDWRETIRSLLYPRFFVWKLWWKFIGSKALKIRVVNKNQTRGFLENKNIGVPKEKITYIPSMYIDLNVFKREVLEKKYDLIFIGRLETNKGIDLLFQAIKLLISDKNTKFKKSLIIGDGTLRKFVNHKVKLLKDYVDYDGGFVKQDEMVRLINKSKMLVMPSYNEGGPRVVVEAMACGVPVLATNVGLIPDFADKNAVKIIDWNAEDIAKKIKELLENKNEMDRLTTVGLEIAKQFDKKVMIKNYADSLKDLIKK